MDGWTFFVCMSNERERWWKKGNRKLSSPHHQLFKYQHVCAEVFVGMNRNHIRRHCRHLICLFPIPHSYQTASRSPVDPSTISHRPLPTSHHQPIHRPPKAFARVRRRYSSCQREWQFGECWSFGGWVGGVWEGYVGEFVGGPSFFVVSFRLFHW